MNEPPRTRDLFEPTTPVRIADGPAQALLLGHDLEAEILLMDSGEVAARLGSKRYLINTSLATYTDSLIRVGQARDALAVEQALDADAVIDALEQALIRLDPAALGDPDGYWSNIIEQMRYEQF